MYSVVGTDGQVYGPIDIDTLTQWINEGRVLPTTNLIDPIDGRVIQAQHAPVLYGKFASRPAAPPNAPAMPQAPSYHAPGAPANQVIINNSTQQVILTPPKSKVVAILLAFFFGALGIHRFYLGRSGTGVLMLLLCLFTCGWGGILTWLWALIDILLIATGGLKDNFGRDLT